MSLRLSNDALIAGNLDVSRTTNTRKLYAKGTSADEGLIRLDRHDDTSYISLDSVGFLGIRRQNAAGRNISLLDNFDKQTLDVGYYDGALTLAAPYNYDTIGDAIRFRRKDTGDGDRNVIYSANNAGSSGGLVVRGHQFLALMAYGSNVALYIQNSGTNVLLPQLVSDGKNVAFGSTKRLAVIENTTGAIQTTQSIPMTLLTGNTLSFTNNWALERHSTGQLRFLYDGNYRTVMRTDGSVSFGDHTSDLRYALPATGGTPGQILQLGSYVSGTANLNWVNMPSGGDNLGNHTATQNLDMDDNDIVDVSMITFSDLNSNTNKWSLFENAENGAFETHISSGVPTRKFRIEENGQVEFGGVKYPISTGSAGQVLTISSPGQAAWQASSSLTFDAPLQLSSGNVTFNIISLGTPSFSSVGPSYRHLDADQFIFRDTNANPVGNRQTSMLHIRQAVQSRITTQIISTTTATVNYTGSNGDYQGRFLRLNNANTVTITMEANSASWPPVGTQYIFFREGGATNATVNFNRGTGVAFTSRAGNVNLKTTQVGESVTFIYLGSNVYAVLGDSIAQ